MSIMEIGCCGAYCGKCKVLKEQMWKGCKLGYDNKERDLSKAKCRIKVCCISRNYRSCADCPEIEKCQTIN
jgi:hypothetical protein